MWKCYIPNDWNGNQREKEKRKEERGKERRERERERERERKKVWNDLRSRPKCRRQIHTLSPITIFWCFSFLPLSHFLCSMFLFLSFPFLSFFLVENKERERRWRKKRDFPPFRGRREIKEGGQKGSLNICQKTLRRKREREEKERQTEPSTRKRRRRRTKDERKIKPKKLAKDLKKKEKRFTSKIFSFFSLDFFSLFPWFWF